MIVVIEGLAGSGKSWLMSRMLRREWISGAAVHVNYPVHFKTKTTEENDGVFRWHVLDELYNLKNGVIGIDEGQKLFDARRWQSLPMSFAEKIGQQRHHYLDIFTTTQNIAHIDARVRQNIHELYVCYSVVRFPRNDRVKPIFQMIRVTKKLRAPVGESDRLLWTKVKTKYYFISRYWSAILYDTYADIGFEKLICKIERKNGKWLGKIYSRDLINSGKKRL